MRRFGPAGVVTRVAVSVWRRISFAAREGALQKLSPALGARAERGVPAGTVVVAAKAATTKRLRGAGFSSGRLRGRASRNDA